MAFEKYGPWAVITGGSEGVGASFARKLAADGINVVLVARKVDALEALAQEIRDTYGVQVRTKSVDLADYRAIDQVREITDDIEVGFLIYNAGANKVRGDFIDLDPQAYRDLIGINIINQAEFMHHYGALMKPRGRGGIIMTGSTASYLGAATLATYCGVKAFSRLWTEAVWAECKPMGIDVLHLVINFTATPAMVRAGYDISKAQSPDEVAQEALDALGKEPVHIMGGEAAKDMMVRRNGIEHRGDLIHSSPRHAARKGHGRGKPATGGAKESELAGQIIIVSGTSGTGKSTACELFAKRSDEFWLLYGIDHFLAGSLPAQFGHHGPRSREGIYAHPLDENNPDGPLRWSFGPKGQQAFATLHEWVAAASREGCNIIFDHLLMSDPPVIQDIIWRLKDLPVLLVTLHCPYEVLSERIANRTMDKKMPSDLLGDDFMQKIRDRLARLRPWFYDAVYANDIEDLRIDTVANSPGHVCELIEKRLAEGPGTAFDKLRRRYPC